MRAVRLNAFGQPVEIEDLPKPTPGDDEVLVRVRAASVNPVDWKIAAGYLGDYFPVPRTLGTDFAGDVEAVGSDVHNVSPGDAVFGMGSGSFADYVVVKADEIAHKPRSLDYVHSAATGLTGLCAWQALFDVAKLQEGERILIHGGGGGVGAPAIQLAKNKGAYVIVNARADQAELARELGADEFIDSEKQHFEDDAGEVDVVLDLIGEDYIDRSMNFCGPGARYVTPAGFLPQDAGESKGILAVSTATQASGEDLAQLAEEIDSGRLKVFVAQTFPLEEAQQALDYKRGGGTRGKVVLTVQDVEA